MIVFTNSGWAQMWIAAGMGVSGDMDTTASMHCPLFRICLRANCSTVGFPILLDNQDPVSTVG